jgi:hypothetical protein
MWGFKPNSRRSGAKRTAVSLHLEQLDWRCAPSSLADATSGGMHAATDKSKADVHHHSALHSPSTTGGNAGETDSELNGDKSSSTGKTITSDSPALETSKKPKAGDASTQSSSATGIAGKKPGSVVAESTSSKPSSAGSESPATPQIANPSTKTTSTKTTSHHAPTTNSTHSSQGTDVKGKAPVNVAHHSTAVTTTSSNASQHSKFSPDASQGGNGSEGGPQIINYGASEVCAGMFEFSGKVLDSNPADIYVAFGGIPSLQGKSIFTDAEGNFEVAFMVNTNGSDDGTTFTQATDASGLLSNIAYYDITAS